MKTFKAYLEAKNYRPKTIKLYLRGYDRFMEWLHQEQLAIHELEYKDLLQLIRKEKISGRTTSQINSTLHSARLYFNYLIEEGQAKENPVVGLYVKGHTKRLPHDLFDRDYLVSLYEDYEVTGLEGHRNKVLLGLLVYQALTREEIEKLEARHLQLREGKVRVQGRQRNASRTLPLEASQVLELHEYQLVTREKLLKQVKAPHPADIPTLFFSTGGRSIGRSLVGFLKSLDPFLTTVKVRESVITYWLKTKDIRTVQYMAGHKYVSSTERYREMHLEELQKVLKKFHPLK